MYLDISTEWIRNIFSGFIISVSFTVYFRNITRRIYNLYEIRDGKIEVSSIHGLRRKLIPLTQFKHWIGSGIQREGQRSHRALPRRYHKCRAYFFWVRESNYPVDQRYAWRCMLYCEEKPMFEFFWLRRAESTQRGHQPTHMRTIQCTPTYIAIQNQPDLPTQQFIK